MSPGSDGYVDKGSGRTAVTTPRHSDWSSHRIHPYAVRVGVDVQSPGPQKADQGHAVGQGELDREAGWRGYRGHRGDPRRERLLHDLEARAATDHQDVPAQRHIAAEQHVADDLVDGVMPAHVLSHDQQLPGPVEERRG